MSRHNWGLAEISNIVRIVYIGLYLLVHVLRIIRQLLEINRTQFQRVYISNYLHMNQAEAPTPQKRLSPSSWQSSPIIISVVLRDSK